MKFIATKELGRLAKWLRILGCDTAYFPEGTAGELYLKSAREDRIILTRNSRLRAFAGAGKLHIRSDYVRTQVAQVLRELRIAPQEKDFFSLCVLCNKRLMPVEKREVRDNVPPHVYRTRQEFRRCHSCGRVYWKGSHWANVAAFVRTLS